jgi:hypothetical protein
MENYWEVPRGAGCCKQRVSKSTPFCSRFFRELLLYEAHELLASHEFKRALEVADSAENWPSTAKPGRVDYLKAEALAAIGERNSAEDHFLRSYPTPSPMTATRLDTKRFANAAPSRTIFKRPHVGCFSLVRESKSLCSGPCKSRVKKQSTGGIIYIYNPGC